MTLRGDSSNYKQIYNVALSIKDVDGLIIELGTHKGGSAKQLLKAINDLGQSKSRHIIGVDCYGDSLDVTAGEWCIYGTRDKRMQFLRDVYIAAYRFNIMYHFFEMTSDTFFKKFSDGIPFYENTKEAYLNKYSLVFIDTLHVSEQAIREFLFFRDKMSENGIIMFDDTDRQEMSEAVEFVNKCEDFIEHELSIYHRRVYQYRGNL